MNMRKRIVTLVAISLMAVAIAPAGVQAQASNPGVVTSPFDQAGVQHNCWTYGTGLCESDGTADRAGNLSGFSKTSASATGELATLLGQEEVTGTAQGFARGGVNLTVTIPKTGASSVDFVIDSRIISADASNSSAMGYRWAEVYYFVHARAGSSQNCTSCTVSVHHTLADANPSTPAPESRSGEDHALTFTLKSAVGDRLSGHINMYFWLTQWTGMYQYGDPIAGNGETKAQGSAVLRKVTATFKP